MMKTAQKLSNQIAKCLRAVKKLAELVKALHKLLLVLLQIVDVLYDLLRER